MGRYVNPDLNRRAFVKTAVVGCAATVSGCLGDIADDSGSNIDFGSNYTEGTSEVFPIMQSDFKENIESETDGQVEVTAHLGGTIGDDVELAEQVQNNTIQAALLSFSNLSMYSDPVDLINIPYFTETNQEFVNLVTSDAWDETIVSEVRESGVEPLIYCLGDPRAIGFSEQIDEPALLPDEMQGMTHRIPASDLLAQIWEMAGANPTPVDWGETPSAMQEGVADSLDTTPLAYVSQGIHDILAHVVLTMHVQDAQVYIVNRDWYDGLPDDIRESVDRAAEMTFEANLEQLPVARENAYNEMEEVDVEIYELDDDQIDEWIDTIGHERSEWDEYKEALAGDLDTFDRLNEATQEGSEWNVEEYE